MIAYCASCGLHWDINHGGDDEEVTLNFCPQCAGDLEQD